jgi:hypothetical protein
MLQESFNEYLTLVTMEVDMARHQAVMAARRKSGTTYWRGSTKGRGNNRGCSMTERTAAEEELIAILERREGRPLTEQEANFAIEQAKVLGEVP